MPKKSYIYGHISKGYQMVTKYTNIGLPEDLIKAIDETVKKSGLGYKSRGEFVKEAVRNFLMRIKRYKL